MSRVLTILKRAGKCSCRELAERMGRDVRSMMNSLEEMRDRGAVSFVNGYWSVSDVPVTKSTADFVDDIPAFVRGGGLTK